MEFEERYRIQQEARALLSEKNRQILDDYDLSKDTLSEDVFGKSILDLDDVQFDQICDLARKSIPGSLKVLEDVTELEDWLIEKRRNL